MRLPAVAITLLGALGVSSASAQLPAGPISPACMAPVVPHLAPSASTPALGGTSRLVLTGGTASTMNSWASAGQTRFHHLVEGPPGPVRLTLETCSSASGGETVAIYPATAAGERVPRRPRVMFSIAVRRGNIRYATATIPPGRAKAPGVLSLVVVVENASGRFHQGAYRLTVNR